jgi:hypothetical protein
MSHSYARTIICTKKDIYSSAAQFNNSTWQLNSLLSGLRSMVACISLDCCHHTPPLFIRHVRCFQAFDP